MGLGDGSLQALLAQQLLGRGIAIEDVALGVGYAHEIGGGLKDLRQAAALDHAVVVVQGEGDVQDQLIQEVDQVVAEEVGLAGVDIEAGYHLAAPMDGEGGGGAQPPASAAACQGDMAGSVTMSGSTMCRASRMARPVGPWLSGRCGSMEMAR